LGKNIHQYLVALESNLRVVVERERKICQLTVFVSVHSESKMSQLEDSLGKMVLQGLTYRNVGDKKPLNKHRSHPTIYLISQGNFHCTWKYILSTYNQNTNTIEFPLFFRWKSLSLSFFLSAPSLLALLALARSNYTYFFRTARFCYLCFKIINQSIFFDKKGILFFRGKSMFPRTIGQACSPSHNDVHWAPLGSNAKWKCPLFLLETHLTKFYNWPERQNISRRWTNNTEEKI
jgi:hypothetical protein